MVFRGRQEITPSTSLSVLADYTWPPEVDRPGHREIPLDKKKILYLVFRGRQEITPSTRLSVLADYYLASGGRQARPQRNPSSQGGGAVSSTR
jgi:hypothetical protein